MPPSNFEGPPLAKEVQINELSISDCEQRWKEMQGHENAHLYRRHVVGRAFQLGYYGVKKRETHTFRRSVDGKIRQRALSGTKLMNTYYSYSHHT